MDTQCLCNTKGGKRCRGVRKGGSNYCRKHKDCDKQILLLPEENIQEKKLFVKKEKKPKNVSLTNKKKREQLVVEELPFHGEAQLEGDSPIIKMFLEQKKKRQQEEEEEKRRQEEEVHKKRNQTFSQEELEEEKELQKMAKRIEEEDRELKERESIRLREMIYIIDKDVLGGGIPSYKRDEIEREEAILRDTEEIGDDFKVYDGTNTLVSCEKYRSFRGIVLDRAGPIKIIDKKVGDISTLGSVYITCIGDKCDYITKVMDLLEKHPALIQTGFTPSSNLFFNYNTIKNEILMQIKASQSGLCPRIVDVFFCSSFVKEKDSTGKYSNYVRIRTERPFYLCSELDGLCNVAFRRFFIIMEKMDITVNTFLLNFMGTTSLVKRYKNRIETTGLGLLSKLHSIGIIHGDAHASNFMFNLTEPGKQYLQRVLSADTKEKRESAIREIEESDRGRDFFGSFASMKLIDFGKSIDLSKKRGNPQEDISKFQGSLSSGIN